MIYAKLYVDVYTHPRFIKAGFEASGYWMHALAYLRHQESSDGFLAEETITVPLAGRKAQCRRLCESLVSAGLFRKVEGGYVLLRYAEKNETKADILAAKAEARERKSRSRHRVEGTPTVLPARDGTTAPVTRDVVASVTCDTSDAVTRTVPSSEEDLSRVPPSLCLDLVSDLRLGSASESGPLAGDASARRPLPPSERAVSGSYWLAAFTEGITSQTCRPCTVGRMYVSTLERIVEHHAPERDAARACAWLRAEATAFAAKWDGKHPPKGLTPDGLERWLNEGRVGPPEFGKPRIVQLPPEEWKPDDFSDLGAVVITGDRAPAPNGKAKPHE